VSSLPHYVHHLTGGDPPVVQEPLGWERLGRTYSHRISGFTWHGGRQRRDILGIRSSVRQRSARSSSPRRSWKYYPLASVLGNISNFGKIVSNSHLNVSNYLYNSATVQHGACMHLQSDW